MTEYLPKDLLPFAARTGRWTVTQVQDQPTLYTTNLGSLIRMVCSGSDCVNVYVISNGNPKWPDQKYAYRVDSDIWHEFYAKEGLAHIELPDSDEHLVEVITAGNTDFDDVWSGGEGFALTKVTTDGGEIKAAQPRKLFNFIGDSITAGCWIRGKAASVSYGAQDTYSALACDYLGLDSVRIAYSAAGVLRPGTGGVPVAREFLTKIDDHTHWKVNKPDYVIVNIGENDRKFEDDEFLTAYSNFINEVVATFPDAEIIVLSPFSQQFSAEIEQVATQHMLEFVDTTDWCTSFTDRVHPDEDGSEQAANHLINHLKGRLTK